MGRAKACARNKCMSFVCNTNGWYGRDVRSGSARFKPFVAGKAFPIGLNWRMTPCHGRITNMSLLLSWRCEVWSCEECKKRCQGFFLYCFFSHPILCLKGATSGQTGSKSNSKPNFFHWITCSNPTQRTISAHMMTFVRCSEKSNLWKTTLNDGSFNSGTKTSPRTRRKQPYIIWCFHIGAHPASCIR